MARWRHAAIAALIAAGSFVPIAALAQQPIETVIALPTSTLSYGAPIVAEAAGLYKTEGLKVTQPVLVGVAAINAVIAGSADFTIGTGPVFLRAAAQGQRLLAIANLIDRPLLEIVLRKDVADRLRITPAMTLAERAKYLKGTTIAIQGVGSIVNAWERYVAVKGGLDPETDVRIAPMEPTAMLAALETKSIDGFTTSMPITTDAVLRGSAVMFASAAQGDAPELLPFAYALIETKPETCRVNREKCIRVVRALAAANRLIRDQPEEALNYLRARFKTIAPPLLEAAWKVVSAAHAKDLRVTKDELENAEKVNLVSKLLDPKDKLASYDGLWTDEYVK
ncbi:MAG TPA: ABC transporter substrate-binding protein [Stellaceae bacterium]|jgi:ABC-type nitrate/sulfonate/bicarbonate transport system substrate-binding protein|nr:ABC transporter substrate-binding protein [Stellaceae bacterium]